MSLEQRTEMPFDRHGEKYPVLNLRIAGVHDVGRIIATLARGNCEHAGLAYEVGRELNRTSEGRATLAYLERQGGPKLGPQPCEECADDNHAGCFHDPYNESVCGCFEAGEIEHAADLEVVEW